MKASELTILLVSFLLLVTFFGRYFVPGLWDIPLDYKTKLEHKYMTYSYEREIAELSLDDPQPSQPARSIPVLVYHGIVDTPTNTSVTRDAFKDQMFALKRAGYRTITHEDFKQYLRGEKSLPEKSVLVTFDDGRKDSYYPVDPLLEALDYNAVMFLISKHATANASKYYLTRREVDAMLATGRWEIQSHGHDSHEWYPLDKDGAKGPFLTTRLWLKEGRRETPEEYEKRISADLKKARDVLTSSFGRNISTFAFPFGEFGQNPTNYIQSESRIVRSADKHYDLVFYQNWPGDGFTQNYPHIQNFMVKRITVPSTWSGNDLVAHLEDGRYKNIPYEDDFASDRGWVRLWGDWLSFYEGKFIMRPGDGTSAAAFLDGSNSWQNYHFSADVADFKGKSMTLYGYFRDGKNTLSCEFLNSSVRVREQTNGTDQIIARVDNLPVFPLDHRTIGISVTGSDVSCFVDNALVVQAVPQAPPALGGGIGMKFWGDQPETDEVYVETVKVVPLG